jgi:methionyl-tRNA synthetase
MTTSTVPAVPPASTAENVDLPEARTDQAAGAAQAGKPFYITTPIYYVNDRPHIGTAYPTLAADTIARFHRQRGRDVFFLTGTDEHGINNERAARARGVEPQRHVDELAASFKALWQTLDIRYDRFIRTTEPDHRRGALELWRRLQASGDLYRATYRGPYCASCEAYYQDEELEGGNCPIHGRPCEIEEEENTFFRLIRYQPELERLVGGTDFVLPAFRRNEVLAVLRRGLRDFSVTRRNVRWGIPAPGAPGEVLYVWVDALANYLTGIGFPDATFQKYWPADLHLVGKDIIRFHCLYWPALLLSAGLPLPRHVFAHGWLTKDGQKISKTRGNVIGPAALAAEFGSDAVRYGLLRAVPFGQDGDYTRQSFIARYNADLANDFGNLVQRAASLVQRYAGGVVPAPGAPGVPEQALSRAAADAVSEVDAAFGRYTIDEAAAAACALVTAANRYAEETAPWRLARDGRSEALVTALYHLVESARLAAWLLWPFVPNAASEAHRRLCGQPPQAGLGTFGAVSPGRPVDTGLPLFPRAG